MKFFVRFMKNDALPTIAHAHLSTIRCSYSRNQRSEVCVLDHLFDSL